MRGRRAVCLLFVLIVMCAGIASNAEAQAAAPEERWEVEIGRGSTTASAAISTRAASGPSTARARSILKNSYRRCLRYRASPALWRRLHAERAL